MKKNVKVKKNVKHKKQVKLTHHHAKPYRKRHYSSFFGLLVAAVILLVLLVQYNDLVYNSTLEARTFISHLFNSNTSTSKSVSSTYGFSFSYDTNKLYASAYDSANGNLYIGDELSTNRQYQEVRLSSSWVNGRSSTSQMTIRAATLNNPDESLSQIESNFMASGSYKGEVLSATTTVQISGNTFMKSVWHQNQTNQLLSKVLNPLLTTYSGKVNGIAYTISISQTTSSESIAAYLEVLNSMNFSSKVVTLLPINASTAATTHKTWFDSLLFANLAMAESGKPASQPASVYVSSLYSPAVVKIYNVYCQDISIQEKLYLTNDCNGGVSGTGFFVSSDGLIASNGHVVNSNPKDDVIMDALYNAVTYHDLSYLQFLSNLAGVTQIDLPSTNSNEKNLGILIDDLYKIPDSDFSVSNNVSNLVVALGTKQPEPSELLDDTRNITNYPKQDTILHAKVSAIDYRTADGVNGFVKSDVSLLKIDGSNYPVVKLGAISDVIQGANLNILGFPGQASQNGLVNFDGVVSLTNGTVASIKSAAGNGNKLIETDTVIGHGNSGGPAIDDNGDVVGIATYTVNGASTSDATFNYVRDIGDLISLAQKNNISFNKTSKTQVAWQKAIDLFSRSHYSESLKYFNEVKSLYPAHPTVAAFIANANTQIKQGHDIKSFPTILVLSIGLGIVAAGAVVMVFVIRNHKKKHDLYNQHIASGAIGPMVPGSAPQFVQPTATQVMPTTQVMPQQPTATQVMPTTQVMPQQPTATQVMPTTQVFPQQPASTPQNPVVSGNTPVQGDDSPTINPNNPL